MRKKILIAAGLAVPVLVFAVVAAVSSTAANTSAAACTTAAVAVNSNGNGSMSETVLAYQPMVSQYCQKFKIPDYADLALAVMQQESGGTGNDPMQCSECPLNTKYPNSINGITDPAYSVETGVAYLANCIKAADCKSPSDIPGISLALQGYNFGGGFIGWAQERGGYSAENASLFSQISASAHGWPSYGDPMYVNHVMRYYIVPMEGQFMVPLKSYTISRGWGMDGAEFHKGIDFAASAGTNICAAAAGTVTYARFGSAPYGGYGNVVVIKHNETYSTLYGHCSVLLVTAGQSVQQGQVIALVGSTGKSTGNHCHFEVRVHGNQVNPAQYLKITIE